MGTRIPLSLTPTYHWKIEWQQLGKTWRHCDKRPLKTWIRPNGLSYAPDVHAKDNALATEGLSPLLNEVRVLNSGGVRGSTTT